MKLKTYLKKEGLTLREFAKKIGVTHAAIWKYSQGTRTPSLKNLKIIEKVTKGKVTYRDF